MNKLTIIETRNLLHEEVDGLAANQTINAKINFLLEIVSEKRPNFSFRAKQEGRLILIEMYDSEKDITITEFNQAIELYASLLKLIYRLKYNVSPLSILSQRKKVFIPTKIETF